MIIFGVTGDYPTTLIGLFALVITGAGAGITMVWKDAGKRAQADNQRAIDRENYIIKQAETRESLLMSHIKDSDKTLVHISDTLEKLNGEFTQLKYAVEDLRERKRSD